MNLTNISYISAQDFLNEVKNKLKVQYQKADIDDSLMYPVIRHCLSKMGAKVYPVATDTVYVSNYIGELPKDFYKLVLALGCYSYTVKQTNDSPQLYDVTESQIEDFLVTKPSKTWVDDCGDNFYIIQRYETFDITYHETYPLSVSKSSIPSCVNNCFNKNVLSPHQIEIKNGKIYAGFTTGVVYVEYLKKLETEEDLIIPDYPQITEWIKDACIVEGLESIYLSGNGDVVQRLQYMQQELSKSEANARTFIKAFEFSDLYELRKIFYKRYNKFNNMVYGDPNNSVDYR